MQGREKLESQSAGQPEAGKGDPKKAMDRSIRRSEPRIEPTSCRSSAGISAGLDTAASKLEKVAKAREELHQELH